MQMFYSAARGGFYCVEVHGDNMPPDVIEISDELYESVKGRQVVPDANRLPMIFVPEPVEVDPVPPLVAGLQAELDRVAHTHGYDSVLAAISYADEPSVPSFQAEGLAFRAWRSMVWANAYAYLAVVQAGDAAFPTIDEAIAMMPSLDLS